MRRMQGSRFAFGPFVLDSAAGTLLRNDVPRFVAYRRGMIERGFYMLPVNLKRNHISLAHTRENIDETLEVVREVARQLGHG